MKLTFGRWIYYWFGTAIIKIIPPERHLRQRMLIKESGKVEYQWLNSYGEWRNGYGLLYAYYVMFSKIVAWSAVFEMLTVSAIPIVAKETGSVWLAIGGWMSCVAFTIGVFILMCIGNRRATDEMNREACMRIRGELPYAPQPKMGGFK